MPTSPFSLFSTPLFIVFTNYNTFFHFSFLQNSLNHSHEGLTPPPKNPTFSSTTIRFYAHSTLLFTIKPNILIICPLIILSVHTKIVDLMSILGGISNRGGSLNGSTPNFREFTKQASFFLKEKIKTARLALTDVTPAQLLAEEATNGNPGGPDGRTLKTLSKAAFEVDDYWRIVEILHKRLAKFDRTNWRPSYKALMVLEHLLTHGPERIAEEFQCDRDVIREMENFQLVDDKGFNWGVSVRKKSERILRMLEKGSLLKEERDRARKISRGIQGFGSFNHRTEEASPKPFDRCYSGFTDHTTNQEDFFSDVESKEMSFLSIDPRTEKVTAAGDCKENLSPNDEAVDVVGESDALLGNPKDKSMGDHHPFDDGDCVASSMPLL